MIFIFMEAILLLWGRDGHAQTVTLNMKNVTMHEVLGRIMRQTGFAFCTRSSIFDSKETFSINVENILILPLLDLLFKNRPYVYEVMDKIVFIRMKAVEGKIISENGEPLANVTIYKNNTPLSSTTETGEFFLYDLAYGDILSFSYVGCETVKVKYEGKSFMVVKLPTGVDNLVKVMRLGYSQMVHNKYLVSHGFLGSKQSHERGLMSSMQAWIAGLLITPTSGAPGSAYKMQLRGASSIGVNPGQMAYNDPLFIVDGFPFGANSGSSVAQKGNALSSINVDDIESVEVVKDAEGSAIYGSRGANGIVLINTKHGKPGKPTLEAKAWAGIGQVNRVPRMLNVQQYLEARREAWLHDNLLPSPLTAPDLLEWDTLHNTDFRKALVTTNTHKLNLQAACSGGLSRLQYYFSGGYNQETAFLNKVDFYKQSLHGHITYNSKNKRLSLDALGLCAKSNNNAGVNGLVTLYLPPNIPALNNVVSDSGSLSLGYVFKYRLSYRLYPGVRFSYNVGYNKLQARESIFLPGRTQPFSSGALSLGSTYWSGYSYKSLISEPQLELTRSINKFLLTVLARTTVQDVRNQAVDTIGQTASLASNIVAINNGNYKYRGYFLRAGIQFENKFQLNVTGRREASNRIRTNKRFESFGAIGMAWAFSNDSFFRKTFPFVSYGKLKAGYGIAGDDQVAVNYFVNNWLNVSNAGSTNTASPVRVREEDYSWQVARKLDLGIELGLFKDRVFVSVDVYLNRIGKQIIGYPDPARGLNALVAKNSSAIVQNKGVEIGVQYKYNSSGQLTWNANLVLSIPRNKLLSFPGLANSAYAGTLEINKSLSVQQGYQYTGVNRQTGLFEVADLDKDGQITREADYKIFGDLDPKLYGGVQAGIDYKNWGLTFSIEGRVQKGYSLLYQVYANTVPGADVVNLPVDFLNRWHKPGDQSIVQRLSAQGDAVTKAAISNFIESSARITDASYLRFRNVSILYKLPVNSISRGFFKTLNFYVTADNLFTITKYKGADPETQNIFTLPPLSTLIGGVRLSF